MLSGVTTVVIIDDSDGYRAIARDVLERQGLRVVGEAATGQEGVRVTEAERPDGVLLDMGLPDTDGRQVAVELARLTKPPRVLANSSEPETWDADFAVHDKCDLPELDLQKLLT